MTKEEVIAILFFSETKFQKSSSCVLYSGSSSKYPGTYRCEQRVSNGAEGSCSPQGAPAVPRTHWDHFCVSAGTVFITPQALRSLTQCLEGLLKRPMHTKALYP